MEPVETIVFNLVQRLCLLVSHNIYRNNAHPEVWDPSHSFKTCYDCGTPFSIFNWRHDCQNCGHLFCGKCSVSTLPSYLDLSIQGGQGRICKFCFKLKQDISECNHHNETNVSIQSFRSLSSKSSSLSSLTNDHTSQSFPSLPSSSLSSDRTPGQISFPEVHTNRKNESIKEKTEEANVKPHNDSIVPYPTWKKTKRGDSSPNPYDFISIRSEDDETNSIGHPDEGFFGECRDNELDKGITEEVKYDDRSEESILKPEGSLSNMSAISYEDYEESINESSFLYSEFVQCSDREYCDIEKNALIWAPPPAEDPYNETGIPLIYSDDDDDDDEDKDDDGRNDEDKDENDKNGSELANFNEQTTLRNHRTIMRTLVKHHFKLLAAQLLDDEGLCPADDGNDSWLKNVVRLANKASRSIKTDSTIEGGMDPNRYIKIKCIASGYPRESQVIKGVVCKKNVADRHMSSQHKNPKLLLLGGSLEYQLVPSQHSSLETMGCLDDDTKIDAIIAQEEEYFSTVMSSIESYHPHIILVEKNVSRKALQKLLSKNITLVQKVPKPLLQRIARYTGAEIAETTELLMQAKLGYCESFHVDKFLEYNKSTGQNVKKTLMFFDGCDNAPGCTILLRGADMDELKTIKKVIKLAVFAAYRLALETSFLVDEGVSFQDLSLHSSKLEWSMPDLSLPNSSSVMYTPFTSFSSIPSIPSFQTISLEDSASIPFSTNSSMISSYNSSTDMLSWSLEMEESSAQTSETISRLNSVTRLSDISSNEYIDESSFSSSKKKLTHHKNMKFRHALSIMSRDGIGTSGSMSSFGDSDMMHDFKELPRGESELRHVGSGLISSFSSRSHIAAEDDLDEEFPSKHSDHQSILVSFSSTCSRKRIICEKGQFLRIKYYGTFDMPLGKFLKENVFKLNNGCAHCGEARDAHIHSYMHQRGRMTISVRHQGHMLAGERDGKIWMWHRCLKCHYVNNVPPATKRILMSDAAWGLSFGKFLELSFSDHAAASKVAACGHSLHRDCLHFYGFSDMVACFRYSPINVHSVYLPPPMLEFHNPELDRWLLDELNEIIDKGILIFSSAFNTLHQLEERMVKHHISDIPNAKKCLLEYDALLKRDLENLRDTLCKAVPKKQKESRFFADIFVLNSTRRLQAILFLKWREEFRETFHKLQKAERDAKSANSDLRSFITIHDINLQTQSIDGQTVLEELCQEASNIGKDASVDDFSRAILDANDRSNTTLSGSLSSYEQTEYGPEVLVSSLDMPKSSLDFLDRVFSKLSFRNISTALSHKESAKYPLLFTNPYKVVQPGGEGRLSLPLGINDTTIPVYDHEPTSLIAYALMSYEYQIHLRDDPLLNDSGSSINNLNQQRRPSPSDMLQSEQQNSNQIDHKHNQMEEFINTKYYKGPHVKVAFKNTEHSRKLKFAVTSYYAKQFHSLRKLCCFDECDFIRSLCRCKKWVAEGGKSKVFFAKTKDDRFVVKQVTKPEIESFLDFAPQYFNYLTESQRLKSPTCLGKILGIFQVTMKHRKGIKKTKMDVLVMENLLYGKHINRLYDLKGSERSRYASGENKVLLDENLIEFMATDPIYIEKKSKRLLERAIWNDTAFLASLNVMDYSLLVGIDEERKELVVGIIDYIRQYTWDKRLETQVKASGILGGPKDKRPTVISPKEYKDRFRKAMKTYFLMVPDQWSPT